MSREIIGDLFDFMAQIDARITGKLRCVRNLTFIMAS